VRDVVVRGDCTIIRNLKHATDVTNKNLKAMSQWMIETLKVDSEWLAEKINFSSTRTQHSLDDIKLMLVGGNKKSALQSMWHETRRLQDELADLAQEASSHSVSNVTAREALERFSRTAGIECKQLNTNQALRALTSLNSMHATSELHQSYVRVTSESRQSHVRVTSESRQSYVRVTSESRPSCIRIASELRRLHPSDTRVTSESRQSYT